MRRRSLHFHSVVVVVVVFFFPPSRAFDRRSRAGALTPADRSCLRYITRVMENIKFASRQLRALFESLWILLLRTAAENWPRFSLAPLDFNCWSRLSYQLHLFSVKMFFMSAVFLSFQLFVNHPIIFFFLSFFFFFTCYCCCRRRRCCLCIYPPSANTSLLFTPLSLRIVLLFFVFFVTTEFMTNSLRCHFTPAGECLPLDQTEM